MSKTDYLNLRIDPQLKADAQALAQELGLPLSDVMGALLRDFVRQRGINLRLPEDEQTHGLERADKRSTTL